MLWMSSTLTAHLALELSADFSAGTTFEAPELDIVTATQIVRITGLAALTGTAVWRPGEAFVVRDLHPPAGSTISGAVKATLRVEIHEPGRVPVLDYSSLRVTNR